MPGLSRTLAAAFADDPVFAWLIPDPARRPPALEQFFTLELRHVALPRGRVWASPDGTGASLELPPDAWRMPPLTQLAHGLEFARVFRTRLGRAMALITLMEHRHPRDPHLYIPYVGVAPHAQGRGLGSTLLQATLRRCDRERLPAYLEATSERNRALYQRLGFDLLGELRLGSGPPLWPMRRAPKPAAPSGL